MYIYYYKIFDKYHHEVVSLAILTDDDASYKPDTYRTATGVLSRS